MVDDQAWAERNAAWERRVQQLGVERAVYHKRHKTAEDFEAVSRVQVDAILPVLAFSLRVGDGRILDFGCGHGRWTDMLADIVSGVAIGVDPTQAFLDRARQRSKNPNVEFRHYADGVIPVDNGWADVIWSCMVLSTVIEETMFAHTLQELRRVSRVGSLVCLIDNTSMADGRPVRSPYSISRTIREYQTAFEPWVKLKVRGDYQDFGEINTIFTGRVHA